MADVELICNTGQPLAPRITGKKGVNGFKDLLRCYQSIFLITRGPQIVVTLRRGLGQHPVAVTGAKAYLLGVAISRREGVFLPIIGMVPPDQPIVAIVEFGKIRYEKEEECHETES